MECDKNVTNVMSADDSVTIPREEYDLLKRRSTLLDVVFDYNGNESWKLAEVVQSVHRILFWRERKGDPDA